MADVNGTVLADFATHTLRKAIDEPALVYVSISTISPSLELQNSTKTVEVLSVGKDLTFVDKVLLLSDADQF